MATRKPAHRPGETYEFEAIAPIYHGNVLAYAVGDLVPAANVDTHGYTNQQVRRRDTEATPAVDEQPARRSKRPADDAPAT